MSKRRELLAVGVIRDFRFCNMDEVEIYLHELDHREVQYRVLQTCPTPFGPVLCRILQQYNNVELIKL